MAVAASGRSESGNQQGESTSQHRLPTIYFDFTYLFSSPSNHTGIQRVIRSLYKGLKYVAPSFGIAGIIPVALINGAFYRIPEQAILGEIAKESGSARPRTKDSFVLPPRTDLIAVPSTERILRSAGSLREVPRHALAKFRASDVHPALNRVMRCGRKYWQRLIGHWRVQRLGLKKVEPSRGDCFLSGDTAWDEADALWRAADRWRREGLVVVAIFYDALPYRAPQFFLARNVTLWKSYYFRGMRTVDAWAAISETARKDFCDMFEREWKRSPESTFSFPLGVSLEGSRPAPGDQQESGSSYSHSYFLCVGSLDARKGHDVLLEAFSNYPGESHLIIIGRDIGRHSQAIVSSILEHACYGRSLFWIRDASDPELATWYRHSQMVVCPSRAEGFGLPLIEAAFYGKTVIANRIPIFEEVGATYGLDVRFYATNQAKDLALCLSNGKPIATLKGNHTSRPIPDWTAAAADFLKKLESVSGFPGQG